MINEELINKTIQILENLEYLVERNSLAHIEKFNHDGRHYVMLSAKREYYTDANGNKQKMTPEIHKQRHEALKKKIRDAGYGFREVVGTYEGNEERSLLVPANNPGDEEGKRLVYNAKGWARAFGGDDINAQDSIYHHNGKNARLIGTNSTGYPGKNKSVNIGHNHYGNRIQNEPFKTEFDYRRKEKNRRKFSSIKE